MEEVMNALKKIQRELDDQKTTIRESAKNVTEQVTLNINKMLEEKFFIWEEKHEKLKELVENQEKRIYFLEKQARQRNVIFFGIEETESSYENLEINIIKWIEQYLSITLTYIDIQEARRLGKKGDRPRPIAVTFSTLGIKIKILKQKQVLKDTNYYIQADYPKHVLEKRKELKEQMKLEREKGNTATLKYDKLIITESMNKRKLSLSPENSTVPKLDKTTQANKKNKPQQVGTTAKRSNSISEGVIKPGMLNFLVNKNTTKANNTQNEKDTNI